MLIDYRQLDEDLVRRTGSASVEFTGPVPAGLLRSPACDADLIIPVLLGGQGEVLDVGRAEAQPRWTMARCFVPGITR
ncbi:MAG: hypothetical protein IIZ13_09020 [Renibacterium sp.]|nr:hypothetical protein [Renibacterium sp.]